MAEFIVNKTKLKIKGVFINQIIKTLIVKSSLIINQILYVAAALFKSSNKCYKRPWLGHGITSALH